jgi:hypothetical protein
MTTRPQPADPLTAMTRADGTTVRHSFDHGSLIDVPINAKYFGVKGDGSDDTTALQDAIDATFHPDGDFYHRQLVIPYTDTHYEFGSLDWHTLARFNDGNEVWQRVDVYGKLRPQETMTLPARRFKLVGHSGAQHQSFAGYGYAEIDCSDISGTDSALEFDEFLSTSFWMEGFSIHSFSGIGFEMRGDQPDLRFRGIHFRQDAAATGDFSCVYLAPNNEDNFNISWEYCGFETNSDTGFGLELWDAGLVEIDRCYFGNKGIALKSDESTTGGITISHCLAEGLAGAAVTLDSSLGNINGVYIHRFENADSDPSSAFLKNTGTDTYDVWVTNCGGSSTVVESGSDKINGLFSRQSRTTASTTIGQDFGYEHSDRFGRKFFGAPLALAPQTFTNDATTQTAGSGSFYVLTNASATTITNFTNEVAGQLMFLLFGNGNTTIQDNAGVNLRGNQNFTGATGDTMLLISDGTVWYEVSRATEASAYTQTYATADKTHAAPTAATLTVADGAGTNDNTIGAITADASVIAAVQEIADEINKLVADVADVKQVVNSIIDDLQALGIVA